MNSNRKRKVAPGATPDSDGTPAKKAKIPTLDAQTTKELGLMFIDRVKNAKDKQGRIFSDLFLELPDKADLPDYYDQIKLPIALNTVEAKLNRDGYANLTEVESDLKRLVANAKRYNDPTSIVHHDAERIRKMIGFFMTEHNPAYKDPNYVPFPTPIPEGLASYTPPETKTPRRDASEPRKPTVTLSLKNRKSSVAADSPGATEPAIGTPVPSGDFAGRSFQQAQEQIVNELLTYTEDTDLLIYGPFINLPSRSLTEYYKTIKKPMSLSAIKKKVTGKHGREDPTGVSDFKSWDNFEDEVSLIWNNAKLFNEDGSEIFVLAEDFEQHFKERLALAKEQVEGPQQPKITLKSRPKPVLHLGSKGSPAPAATSGVTIDTEALARQKQAVQTGLNGHANAAEQRPSLPHSRSESLIPGATPVKAPSPSLIPASVKAEKSGVPSPALANARLPSTAPEAARPATATSMLPPAARIASGSPRPAAAAHAPFQTPQIPSFVPAPTTFLDNFTRKTPVADALLPNVSITSHPQLPLPKPFKLDVAPSSSYTHQSLTVSLAPSHYWVQIAPTVSQQLLLSKQYKLFVTVNGVRLMATNRGYVNGEMNGSATTRQVYDAQLLPGVNRIEVEIAAVNAAATAAAGAAKIVHGANGVSGGSETEKAAEKTTRVPLETEKVTVFANLLRNL